MQGARHKHAAAARDALSHQHCLSSRGRAIPHGCVGHFLPGKLGDQGLKFEDGLQRALADFGLVGRIGGEELAAQQDRVGDHGT